MIELGILGPLEVIVDGKPVELRRAKQRSLLALLLLRAGEVVSIDTLMDELWGGSPPATAKDALQNYVSQLRKTLGQDAIVTRAPGYVLELEAGQTDVGRFEQLVSGARGEEDTRERAAILRNALALWRGPALADLAYEGFATSEAARLEELRAAAHEDLIDAELELGGHVGLVPELEGMVERHPFDERARAQLMLALYRSGRQADALEAFQDARRTLAEELGLEPSPALRELERAILLQEPSLVRGEQASPAASERRKTVTVLAAELSPVADQDPERFRETLVHGITVARAAIEGHEGWVTARSEDELLGVFGVPASHEDDALRACRAATELRDALAAGPPIAVRLAVETGEVVTGYGFVSGDVLRQTGGVARRARPGDVVLGERAHAIVRHAVEGRRGASGFRLASVQSRAPAVAHHAQAPLVGRVGELAALRERLGAAVRSQRCEVVVVSGEPGIGKSRLIDAFVESLGDEAAVVAGQCIAYGEGAAYSPLRDIVSTVDVGEALAGEADSEQIASGVARLVEGQGSIDEGFWAIRRLFEALASVRPLVIVLEDLHWSESRLLDLVDLLAAGTGRPLLVVCAARPELFDERPTWAGWSLALDSLSDADIESVVASLGGDLEPATQERLVGLAEGNALLAEQLHAYVDEQGEASLGTVPPSVEALLAARLDLLAGDVRATAQRAALIGRDFSREALAAMSAAPTRPVLSTHLIDLVRRGLVHPEPVTETEEPFRFHHALVRDVAYSGLPKAERAELHEAYGDWLIGRSDAADEVIGYHLEQAHHYRTELAPPDRRAKQLALDAGTRLGEAGMRAWRRADVPSTIDLLGRATSLLPDNEPWRRELLCELGVAHYSAGEARGAEEALKRALNAASEAKDSRVTLRAQFELAYVHIQLSPEGQAPELVSSTSRAIPVLELAGDDRGLARAWLLLGFVEGGHFCRNKQWEEAAERAVVYYRRSAWPASTCLGQLCMALYYGPTPARNAIARCKELLADADVGRAGTAQVLRSLAGLVAMVGEFESARTYSNRAREIFDDLGQKGAAVNTRAVLGDIELLAGEADAARHEYETLCRFCEESGEFGLLSTYAGDLADSLRELDDDAGAEHWSRVSEGHAASDDVGAQFAWRAARAPVLARRGELEEAARLARQAVELADPTDALNKRAAVLLSLADVLRLRGEDSQADDALARAVALYERKGNVVAVERATAHD